MRRALLFITLLLAGNFAIAQLRIVPGSIEEMNFGVFYLTGNGQGSITINPASPSSSSFYGVAYDDLSTIKPFTFRLEKTVNEKLTVIFGKGGAGSNLNSQAPKWGHVLRTVPNSYEIYVEGDVLESFNQNKLNFREGRGTVTVKVGATLIIPNKAPDAEYIANSQYILHYYTNWQYIP